MTEALNEMEQTWSGGSCAAERSSPPEMQRSRRSRALLDLIEAWEAQGGPISRAHLDRADTVLDRHARFETY